MRLSDRTLRFRRTGAQPADRRGGNRERNPRGSVRFEHRKPTRAMPMPSGASFEINGFPFRSDSTRRRYTTVLLQFPRGRQAIFAGHRIAPPANKRKNGRMFPGWLRWIGLASLTPATTLAFEIVDTLPFPSRGGFPGAYPRDPIYPTLVWAQVGLLYHSNPFGLPDGASAPHSSGKTSGGTRSRATGWGLSTRSASPAARACACMHAASITTTGPSTSSTTSDTTSVRTGSGRSATTFRAPSATSAQAGLSDLRETQA